MILFAQSENQRIYALQMSQAPSNEEREQLEWLLNAAFVDEEHLDGSFIGPRKEMVTPWSTNAVEITQNMGIKGIVRIEEFRSGDYTDPHDKMLEVIYPGIGQDIFEVNLEPEPIRSITDIAAYNRQEGLALSGEEINYLEHVAKELGRPLTDSEVFGFSQVNSEHCRHKIFNGTFVIDGKEKPGSLFQLIKKTTNENPNDVVSAYKDNVSFTKGPVIEQFAPATQDKPDYFEIKEVESVLSLKAETHNFPTTVEPFNGAATGSGGEIRDRLAGGKAATPMAGTAVYMTSYSRTKNREWEEFMAERPWLYQSPMEILIKASNGASDFGNKFGQPLINGSVLTFEHSNGEKNFGYDKVIMLAGGIGYGLLKDAKKDTPQKGDKVVVMGGDNYRIGMGGGAVSSVDTGEFHSAIELNAIQRSNPEMQKRVANAIRAMLESGENPIVSIHDHGAGGHLNCLSELVEDTGGEIDLKALPVGDPTLSAREIIGNESQERMGLVMKEKDIELLRKISDRERAPLYVVGDITGDMKFTFKNEEDQKNPIDLKLEHLFGSAPRTIMKDETNRHIFRDPAMGSQEVKGYILKVLQMEAVACKDWLTNKVDRSVTGKVAQQQNVGPHQLPLAGYGAVALDYQGGKGIATSIGHAPVPSLIDAAKGSRLAITEALTNIVFSPLEKGLKSLSLSANWMWPCKNKGEDARLYEAVEAVSEFAIGLGINIPTGKDSLSMTQKYQEGVVYAPGTVIISASGAVSDIRKNVTPELKPEENTRLLHIDFSDGRYEIGGSCLTQVCNGLGNVAPDATDAAEIIKTFNTIQDGVKSGDILAGHDVAEGGLITTLLEMCFPTETMGLELELDGLPHDDFMKLLFSESPAVLVQVKTESAFIELLEQNDVRYTDLGAVNETASVQIKHQSAIVFDGDIAEYRKAWFESSWLLDRQQTAAHLADVRFKQLAKQPVTFEFPEQFTGKYADLNLDPKRKTKSGVKAAIIREKGVNGDREMAYSLYLAGFDVKDVHMTDLINGREDLSDVNMIVFVGGFSNSDVLGSAKGWAGAFLYNKKAKEALDNFYKREDTLSLGVCNGCQLMVELGLVYPGHDKKPKMRHNDSKKFESNYITVTVPENNSVMLSSLAGSKLGIWVAHGEGKFELPLSESDYSIPMKYAYANYPNNPNGSAYETAGIVSEDGRHLAIMPHLERSIFPWQCGFYPYDRKSDDFTPWLESFVNARKWVEGKN